ncbi:vacuolar protein sorting-associated protein 54, chloroplastic-like [Papaver somniferum]|uniref:vacuolar protein sorting-associated protein 54, chloroplastic-like n=1 Tax=Papaver somniferum TaxID=3469 RepID=UPI000E6F5634|nr:vacuolar protein sorting-associated protein 54, chloroplastic-like [Papaver somniferum]XP_026458094.1 vacuolar protein sorting-associated protein 54, chloroplastic-like [Papaver somniferum]XP_026458095.1 vacuolar protein sorting-associated protein 54, chloroplastic-like [Papaver somniferum]
MDSSQSGGRYENLRIKRTTSTASSTKSDPSTPTVLPSPSSSTSYGGSGSQNLSSILNNPRKSTSVYGSDSSSLFTGWFSSSTSSSVDFSSTPLVLKQQPGSEVSKSDFKSYLNVINEPYGRFEDIRNHSNKENLEIDEKVEQQEEEEIDKLGFSSTTVGQGEALVNCLREVPSLYFKEDFALEEGPTFEVACPFKTILENIDLQEKLSHYLDTVELHLVKEISLRSNSFFEAQGQLYGLNIEIVEACGRIRELKETIRLLNKELVEPAKQIQDLNSTRINLIALQQKLTLILYVNQALSALKLLVAAADCAGALDVTDDLRNLLDTDELAGLHCFRHLRDQLATSIQDINRILSAEFMCASIYDVKDGGSIILARIKAGNTSLTNGKDDDFKMDEEEMFSFRDRLLPFIVGLLRTKELPSELRNYREALTANMKTAIKTTVAELLPLLVAQPMESGLMTGERTPDADGGGASLAGKLRSLASESFIRLLDAIFKVVQVHLVRAAEVKKAVEWIMSNLDSCYASDSISAANAEAGQELSPYSLQKNASKSPTTSGKANDISSPNMSRNLRAEVLRENTEAVFAACDAAHGRWAKLLGVRALLHPKLRLQEFLSIYNITQDFISATEKIGGRLGYSIRGTLQSQSKAFVSYQHDSRMAKIKAVLDQETWTSVDVPDEFQAIVKSFLSSEVLTNGGQTEALGSTDISSKADGSPVVLPSQLIGQNESNETSADSTGQIKSPVSTGEGVAGNNNTKESAKSASQTLTYGAVGYHMVNSGLILLKMLSEYVQMNNFLPALSFEIVQRVVELLKFFNTRTCQLVLGAGAMQVSGLKSITAKHLALASQVISFMHAIIPEIRTVLFLRVPESCKATLMSEIGRVAQDYKVHRDEIHSKLVQIMRERLLVHLRGLPQIVESWNRPEDNDSQPSQFVRSLTKEVGFFQRILSRTLHENDVQAIFGQVVQIFHTQISDAYSGLEITTPQAKNRLRRDIQQILACIRSLPTDNTFDKDGVRNSGKLDEFLLQKFGAESSQ